MSWSEIDNYKSLGSTESFEAEADGVVNPEFHSSNCPTINNYKIIK